MHAWACLRSTIEQEGGICEQTPLFTPPMSMAVWLQMEE